VTKLFIYCQSCLKMQFITSQKGGRIFLFEGYKNRKDKTYINFGSWRCAKTGCKSRLVIKPKNFCTPTVTSEHTHGPDIGSNEADVVEDQIREKARITQDRPRSNALKMLALKV
jgi:hypothetical protein